MSVFCDHCKKEIEGDRQMTFSYQSFIDCIGKGGIVLDVVLHLPCSFEFTRLRDEEMDRHRDIPEVKKWINIMSDINNTRRR